jgi:hypothetical protein
MFDFMKANNIEEISVGELITAMISAYSYTIEINTATSKMTRGNYDYMFTEEELNSETPTNHYSNLTVPGGTKYTENAFQTPNIINTSVAHINDFAEGIANMLGWFRSDDKSFLKQSMSIQNKEKDFEFAGSKYTQEYSLAKGLVHKKDGNIISQEEYRKAKYATPKTRRILEVQSDLFQKGRDSKVLSKKLEIKKVGDTFISNGEKFTVTNIDTDSELYELITIQDSQGRTATMRRTQLEKRFDERGDNSSENQFLQLLNKDNNWVTFFIKSIIQDSAKKGYEKVLFPTGNTASKVEGHSTLEEFKKQKEDRIKELQELKRKNHNLSVNKVSGFRFQIVNDNGDIMKDNISTYNNAVKTLENEFGKSNLQYDNEIRALTKELERVETEGFGALRPIWNFYENTVTDILKKQGYNPVLITDEYGNTWNEIEIKADDLNPILLQKEDTIKPEVAELFESNPELASIGTAAQYSAYLDTIFPDSQIKDIVYHGSNQKINQFEVRKEPLIHFGSKNAALNRGNVLTQTVLNIKNLQTIKDGMWFLGTDEGGLLKELLDRNILTIEEVKSINKVKNDAIQQSPYFHENYRMAIPDGEKAGNKKLQEILGNKDIGFEYINFSEDKGSTSYAVPSQKQIHILGSKQDIEGFKEFVQGKSFDKELAQKLQNKLQKLYPEIKLNITNNPVWEQGDNIFNQNLENKINSFVLFEDQDKLCPSGICNYTARASTEHLQKIGLNPYPNNYNGSQLPVKVKSPIGDFNIEHYVSAVAINNAIYIYDMPQNEFISNEFFGKGSSVKVKESYKPRLIPLTIDEIKANYNLSTEEAGNFIHSILNKNGWQGADAAPSFKKYIENNIKNPQEYINLLESQIKDSGYEFKQWDVEEYRKEYNDKKQQRKLTKISKKEEQKVINYYENKLKLKTKEYLPKKTDSFSLITLIDSVLGKGFVKENIDLSSFENALQSLDNYLKSEKFVEDLLHKITIAEENLNSINKSVDEVYSLARLFASFTKQVKNVGIEEALKKYDSKQQYTIRTLLPSNVLDKYKSKEQAAFLLQKYWSNKDNIVKALNIYKTKTFTDLITNKFKAYSVFNKYQTVLNFLKSTDFDSSYLYQSISNEAIRRYSYFDKIGNTQFQKDELNRIIGQANIKAMTVLVDAVNQKQDTLPHEYAHHYIAWFRNTPIVQEAIKKWGSEEALVQSIGEQVVKQKGEAWNWWNNFVKWIMNQFNSLSKLQKEELTQILTDAFLTRQDLSKQNVKGFKEFVKQPFSNNQTVPGDAATLFSNFVNTSNNDVIDAIDNCN